LLQDLEGGGVAEVAFLFFLQLFFPKPKMVRRTAYLKVEKEKENPIASTNPGKLFEGSL